VKEREHLGGDGVDNAVDDADDGDRKATRNLRNGKHHFFFLGIGYFNTDAMLSAAGIGAVLGLSVRCCLTLSQGPPGVRPGGRFVAAAHATRKRSTSITDVVR